MGASVRPTRPHDRSGRDERSDLSRLCFERGLTSDALGSLQGHYLIGILTRRQEPTQRRWRARESVARLLALSGLDRVQARCDSVALRLGGLLAAAALVLRHVSEDLLYVGSAARKGGLATAVACHACAHEVLLWCLAKLARERRTGALLVRAAGASDGFARPQRIVVAFGERQQLSGRRPRSSSSAAVGSSASRSVGSLASARAMATGTKKRCLTTTATTSKTGRIFTPPRGCNEPSPAVRCQERSLCASSCPTDDSRCAHQIIQAMGVVISTSRTLPTPRRLC